MTTTPIPTDRYDRLRDAAEILASDPAVENSDSLLTNGESLRAFIHTLAEERVLDGLTEHDANTVNHPICFGVSSSTKSRHE
jgi:hypothetical protein